MSNKAKGVRRMVGGLALLLLGSGGFYASVSKSDSAPVKGPGGSTLSAPLQDPRFKPYVKDFVQSFRSDPKFLRIVEQYDAMSDSERMVWVRGIAQQGALRLSDADVQVFFRIIALKTANLPPDLCGRVSSGQATRTDRVAALAVTEWGAGEIEEYSELAERAFVAQVREYPAPVVPTESDVQRALQTALSVLGSDAERVTAALIGEDLELTCWAWGRLARVDAQLPSDMRVIIARLYFTD